MRYTKKARKTKYTKRTTRVDIIDNTTGQVVASFPTTGGQTREQGVGIAHRNADAELARLNAAAEEAGENYGSREEMQAAENEIERRERLDEDVAKFEDRITEAGRLREELAQNVSARRTGQLLSQLQRSILGTGGDAGMVEALTPQITEQSNRNLQDLITGSQAQTQRDLAQFVPTEIGANYNQDRLSDAMSQFLMNEETQRAQIQASLDSQPEWWETVLGQGAQLAGNLAVKYATGGMV
jgi:hypothetical protein